MFYYAYLRMAPFPYPRLAFAVKGARLLRGECEPLTASTVPHNRLSGKVGFLPGINTCRKVLDIYATSVDYDGGAEQSARFFRVMQNKMHWATHGQTAAEVIAARADADAPNMGLTSWSGAKPRSGDVIIAKNYLAEEEIETLNLIVTAYLDFAEHQARGRKPMTMQDWIAKLDDILRLSERELLTHAGSVSHIAAVAKAQDADTVSDVGFGDVKCRKPFTMFA